MDKDIIIPAHGIYCLEQIEYQACAAEGLIDNVVNPMFQCLSCKGLLEEYAKETGGDLDKAPGTGWRKTSMPCMPQSERLTCSCKTCWRK